MDSISSLLELAQEIIARIDGPTLAVIILWGHWKGIWVWGRDLQEWKNIAKAMTDANTTLTKSVALLRGRRR